MVVMVVMVHNSKIRPETKLHCRASPLHPPRGKGGLCNAGNLTLVLAVIDVNISLM